MSKSIYPSIPAPGKDPASMQATLSAMRQTLSMITLNAQNPNPNFAPSSASQVFVTFDQLQKLGKVGPTGQQGIPGAQGPPGPPGSSGVPEAPADGNTYGRDTAAWVPVLAATAPVFVALPGNYTNDANAAAGGVPLNGVYRNGSQLMVRVI